MKPEIQKFRSRFLFTGFKVAALLSLVGCFSGGLPEPFFEPRANLIPAGRRPAALLVGTEGERDATLGYQRLLGVPVSQIFFSHGASDYAAEQMASTLGDLGYDVWWLQAEDSANLQSAAQSFAPDLAVKLETREFELDVADLFISRRAELSALFEFSCGRGALGEPQSAQITAEEYRPRFHLTELSQFARRTLRREFEKQLQHCERQRRANVKLPPPALAKSALLFFPTGEALKPSLLRAVQASYGRQNRRPFSDSEILRLIQRGAARQISKQFSPVFVAGGLSAGSRVPAAASRFRIRVERAEFVDGALTLALAVLSDQGGKIRSKRCRLSESVSTARDGYLALALEEAAGKLLAEVLAPQTAGGACATGR